MLWTADLNTCKECKGHASKQSRVIRNEQASIEPGVSGLALDAALQEGATEDPKGKEGQSDDDYGALFLKGGGKGKMCKWV